jgi:hypothetical protein
MVQSFQLIILPLLPETQLPPPQFVRSKLILTILRKMQPQKQCKKIPHQIPNYEKNKTQISCRF